MVEAMEYTMPTSTNSAPKPIDHEPANDQYTPQAMLDNSSNPIARQSQANYYYYDPSTPEQSEYMQPSNTQTLASSGASMGEHLVVEPVKETVNPVYKTLIRKDVESELRM